MVNIWKDLFINFLIVLFIILCIFIFSYKNLSINKVIPQSEDYFLSEKMKEDFKEDKLDEAEEVVTTYNLDALDLKKLEKTNEYQKGKKNPFASKSEAPSNMTSSSEKDNDKSGSTGFYKNDGTKGR